MEHYVYWFSIAVGLLIVEMATGTFYMLMLSLAFGAGGAVAFAGLDLPLQMLLGALVGVVGIFALRRVKTTTQVVQGLDIGQAVNVVVWHEDGTARVRYRGAEWDAELESSDLPHKDTLYIKEIHGSKLVLTHQI